MNVQNLSRGDTVRGRVLSQNKNGSRLTIVGLEEKPFVQLYDSFVSTGSLVLVSVRKISDRWKIHKSLARFRSFFGELRFGGLAAKTNEMKEALHNEHSSKIKQRYNSCAG